jgi:predicted GTPase
MNDAYDFGLGEALSQEITAEAASTSMILIVGQTGAGKSHFINMLAPGSCQESARLESCSLSQPRPTNDLPLLAVGTREPALIEVEFDRQVLYLIDTPGFNDTRRDLERSDAIILGEIARTIALQASLGVKMVLRTVFDCTHETNAIAEGHPVSAQHHAAEDDW